MGVHEVHYRQGRHDREAEAGIDIPAYLDAQAGYVANFKNINAQVFMDASANGFAYPSNGNFDWTSSVDEAVQAAFGGVKTVDEACAGCSRCTGYSG